MAASNRQLSERFSHFTECLICLETLKKPKCLPCIHTFCLECLQKYGSNHTEGNEMVCPTCRQAFIVPNGGFEKLPNNFFIQDILEDGEKKLASKDGEVACEVCCSDRDADSGRFPANRYCVDCDQNMCERCTAIHSRMKTGSSHTVVSSSDQRCISVLLRNCPVGCEIHGNKPLEMFCYDCSQILCLTCLADHRGHACTDLRNESKTFADKLRHCLSEFDEYTSTLRQKLKLTDESEGDLVQRISKTNEEISETAEKLITAVRTQRDKLLQKLEVFRAKRLQQILINKNDIQCQLVTLQSFQKYVEELIDHGTSSNILRSAGDLLARAKELKNCEPTFDREQLVKDSVVFVKPDIRDIIEERTCLIGHVTLNEIQGTALVNNANVIHVMSNKDKSIQGVTTHANQLFMVRVESKQIDIYDASNFTQTDRLTVNDMKDPRSLVACSFHNCLYVSDDADPSFIHKVKLNDRSITKWSVKGGPEGLSLTRAHNLLVTLCTGKTLQEFTTRGDLLREISLHDSLDCPCHSVELSTGQFVVCHGFNSQHRVCTVDSHGRIVKSYGTTRGSVEGQLNCPTCLAVDSGDDVLVADCFNDRIQLFSPSLEFLGDVSLPGYTLDRPIRLHLDRVNSRLYVSESMYGGGRLLVVSTLQNDS